MHLSYRESCASATVSLGHQLTKVVKSPVSDSVSFRLFLLASMEHQLLYDLVADRLQRGDFQQRNPVPQKLHSEYLTK